ncbi:MAG: glycosyltransferase family 39 protein [Bacteroidetes bacterium]|nr:glycosyltransferase family 39 protein [Bacteroidota bacterium]
MRYNRIRISLCKLCCGHFVSYFGFHEWIYRALMLLIFSLGMISFAKIVYYYLNNIGVAISLMCFFAATPLLSFYAANFVPDTAALSFFLISWYVLIKRNIQQKQRIVSWAIFFCLASLIKITILIYLPGMLYLIYKNEETKKYIKQYYWSIGAIVILVFVWYFYAAQLSNATESEVFLLRVAIVGSWKEFVEVYQEIESVWMSRLYHPFLTLTLFFIPVFSFVFFSKKDHFDYLAVLLWLGLVGFLLMMWPQLMHHDYYMITLSIVFPISLMLLCRKVMVWKAANVVVPLILFALSIFQIVRTRDYMAEVYNKNNWQYGALHADRYFDLEKELRSIGVKNSDKVISIYDHAPNVSLYLMNQKGVTASFREPKVGIPQYLSSRQFKYLIYNPFSEFGDVPFDPTTYPIKFIKEIYGIKVYSVNSYKIGRKQKSFNLTPWN